MDGNTSNTSAIVEDIPYNNDLIFSLSAVNCVGRSSSITYNNINIGETHTVQQKTFEGENFHDFHGFRATHESFLQEIWACHTHL